MPTSSRIKIFLNGAYRLGLYSLGAFLVWAGINGISLSLLPGNDLITFLEDFLCLTLAITGLILFFQKDHYHHGLTFGNSSWLLVWAVVVLLIIPSLVLYYLFPGTGQLYDILADIFGALYGLAMVGIAFAQPSLMQRITSRIPGFKKRSSSPSKPVQQPTSEEAPPLSEEERKLEKDAKNYTVTQPQHRFSELILPLDLLSELQRSAEIAQTPTRVLEGWGLPNFTHVPYVALHFYGKPGTGKTLAAHALADHLGQNILVVTYADFLAEYLTESNQKIRAVFHAAASNNALLLIDEADTLLSSGASQVISSQVRMSLEHFPGVVIFATNTIELYNKAFETRVLHIRFPMPNEQCRLQLWQANLPDTLPRAEDVDPALLAKKIDDVSGREINRAVMETAGMIAAGKRSQIELNDLLERIALLKKARLNVDSDLARTSTIRQQYETKAPQYRFEQLALAQDVLDELLLALGFIQAEQKIFEEWGLRSIESFPCTALNFYGPPGTGKTLAAHAIADHLGQSILVANYAEIQGIYVGEGPKNADALFRTAARENAVLFIDEADALLTRRLPNVTDGADMMINALSSQMLICLENFHGIVIFATNMVQSYDKAFETRVRHIHFPMPDEECRQKIWRIHLPDSLPRAEDVNPLVLAASIDDICGRDIKNAVIDAATRVQVEGRTQLELNDLLLAIRRIKKKRLSADGDALLASTRQFTARPPLHSYKQLIVSKSVREDLLMALDIIRSEKKIFEEWGLSSIEPFPCTALNFHGLPGTGKTLAAHAIADYLGLPIIVANYGEINGRFVGDAARNVNAIFRIAARENAVLFIDEADALLARRLSNVTISGDMEINSLSNQMLISLENFRGVVIFATNMLQSYDKAFETRVRHIHFPLPDEECRRQIWEVHLPASLPRAMDVDPATLAKQVDEVCGRDIKNAVVEAAARANREGRSQIELHDLVAAIKRIKSARVSQQGERGHAQARSEHNKQVVEQIQRLFSARQGSPAANSSPSTTRPLGDIFEPPELAASVQPSPPSQSDMLENVAAGKPTQPLARSQDDVFAEAELNIPTQPLVRTQSNNSKQPEAMQN